HLGRRERARRAVRREGGTPRRPASRPDLARPYGAVLLPRRQSEQLVRFARLGLRAALAPDRADLPALLAADAGRVRPPVGIRSGVCVETGSLAAGNADGRAGKRAATPANADGRTGKAGTASNGIASDASAAWPPRAS